MSSNPSFDLFHLDEDISRQLHGDGNTVVIPFSKLVELDEEYAKHFMKKPLDECNYLSQMASSFADREVYVQIIGIPVEKSINVLRSKDLYKLIQVRGTVTQRSQKRNRPKTIIYTCPACGTDIKMDQDKQWRESPVKCTNCENRKRFSRNYEKTVFRDYQWIEVQELTENTPNSKSPEKIKILLKDGLVDSCAPGEIITVTGVPRVIEDSPTSLNLELKMCVEAIGVENDTEDDILNITQEDIDEVRKLMETEDHLQNIIKSIAPTIYGVEHVKEALAYQQCEGQTKHAGDTRIRGQFHVLLAGDPGEGKSVLLDFMVLCHPKGRKAIGRGSSGVGLTASVVKEGEQFVLKAGAMVLADNGFLGLDEIEKMRTEDSGTMHPAMEQQIINIDKADISAELKARCSILAACNPLGGAWNINKTMIGNLNDNGKGLPRPLLDRFALIFVLKKNRDSDYEREVIKHIMRVASNPESITSPYSLDTLRKIFGYARTINVTITEEATERLEEFYLVLHQASLQDDDLLITRRQPPDIVRLAESSAKLHGRTEVILKDVENAIRLVAKSLEESGIDPVTGKLNLSAGLYGAPPTKTQRINGIPIVINRLCNKNLHDKTRVSKQEVVDYLVRQWQMPSEEVEELLTVALRDGVIYMPTPGSLARVD